MATKLIALILSFLFLAPHAFAATSAALTGTVRQGTSGAANSHTISLNLDGSGSNLALFCVIFPDTGSSLLKSATWNGAATTTATAVAGAQISGANMVVWTNPALGTHNLVVTFKTGTNKSIGYTCFTFKNVKQSGLLDKTGANNNAGSGTSASTASVTSTSASSFLIGWLEVNTTGSNLSNTDGTILGSQLDLLNGFHGLVSWKSATGGADTLSYSWTTSNAWDNWSDSFFDEAPPAAAETPILGLVRAFWLF